MRKTDRKRDTKTLQNLQLTVNTINELMVERTGNNTGVLSVDRSENIRWNRALFHLEIDGENILEDRTIEELQLFLKGAQFMAAMTGPQVMQVDEPTETEQLQEAA